MRKTIKCLFHSIDVTLCVPCQEDWETEIHQYLKFLRSFLMFFSLFLLSCWMSSTNNLIWIFVTFVVIVEVVSFRFEPIFFLLTLSFAILVWDIIYVTALPQYNSVFISPLSDQHFDSHSSHKGDDQNAAKRRKANSANTVWAISKLWLKDGEFVPNIRSKYYQIPTFETW